MNRRDLFKILAGIGLGAVAIETYERLYHIPMLETMFRKELEYWINQYNTAREEVGRLIEQLRKREGEISSLRSDLARSKEELEHLIQQYNTTKEEANRLSEMLKQSVEEINNLKEKVGYWEARYNTAREEVGRLNSTINKIDELERESTSAIAYYRGRMDEAIRKLKEIIERYRVLLGDERVSFEYSTLKILEDLKLTQEKLQKVLPYFPLVLNFSWKPTKVVNDKIYSIKVIFEVITPLSSLKEVEVMLIPVEYRYFITKYGMREEDYDKVFPEEEVRSVKIKPMNLEREVFSVDFEDLKGGREYIVKARVEDVAGGEKMVEVKTPYIRQFENIAKTDDILVMATYLLWYRDDRSNWKDGHKHQPLLGEYVSSDPLIMSKHIDWATGHGIDGFFISWSGYEEGDAKYFDSNLKILLNNPLASQIKIAILYESIGRLVDSKPGWNLDDEKNIQILKSDYSYIAENYFSHPSYLRINGKPVIYFYEGKGIFAKDIQDLHQKTNEIRAYIKDKYGPDIYWISDHAHPLADPSMKVFNTNINWGDAARLFDSITSYGGYSKEFASPEDTYLSYLRQGFEKWYSFAKNNNLGFIPFAVVGYDPRYVSWGDKTAVPIERDPQKFYERLRLASSYMGDTKILWIHEFNNSFEDTQIEPTVEEGFIFLETLKNFLQSYSQK
jgi:plasmid maintenance system antidote protein VapI